MNYRGSSFKRVASLCTFVTFTCNVLLECKNKQKILRLCSTNIINFLWVLTTCGYGLHSNYFSFVNVKTRFLTSKHGDRIPCAFQISSANITIIVVPACRLLLKGWGPTWKDRISAARQQVQCLSWDNIIPSRPPGSFRSSKPSLQGWGGTSHLSIKFQGRCFAKLQRLQIFVLVFFVPWKNPTAIFVLHSLWKMMKEITSLLIFLPSKWDYFAGGKFTPTGGLGCR